MNMAASKQQRYSLADLAEKSGTPPRTIRFYISRGLLPGPDKAGRAAGYGSSHLERIRRIRELQAKGSTLSEISRQLVPEDAASPAPEPVAWRHYPISDDVMVMVRDDTPPWRVHQIRKAMGTMRQLLGEDPIKEGKTE